MNPELSRRAAKVMMCPAIRSLTLQERNEFVRAIEQAVNFDAMPDKWRRKIIAGETYLSTKGSGKTVTVAPPSEKTVSKALDSYRRWLETKKTNQGTP